MLRGKKVSVKLGHYGRHPTREEVEEQAHSIGTLLELAQTTSNPINPTTVDVLHFAQYLDER